MDPSVRQERYTAKDVERVKEAGRKMTVRGVQGFAFGGALGWFATRSLQASQKMHPSNALLQRLPKINKNHIVVITLANAVMAAYVGISMEAAKRMSSLQEIFQNRDAAKGDPRRDTVTEGTSDPPEPVFEDAASRSASNDTERAPSKGRRTVPRIVPEYNKYQAQSHLKQVNEDSHARRVAAIEAKKQEREGGGASGSSSLGVSKW